MAHNDTDGAVIAPTGGSMKIEYSPNARAKCRLCHTKIAKGSWRVQAAVEDIYHPRSDGSPRISWESCHASCYFENVTRPVNLKNSTQSGFYDGSGATWTSIPALSFPRTETGESLTAVITDLDESDELAQTLPTPTLRDCLSTTVSAAFSGADSLIDRDRELLETFCLHKRLTRASRKLLYEAELAEAQLPQPDETGDPLKSKFTQYSPNSMAHCRDCQILLEEGSVRVGAHVFSSSSRHAGFSINYWCLECICARPAVRRMSRLHPNEIGLILPGVELLQEVDLKRACDYLGIDVPDPAVLSALASERVRSTRSGRKFNTWGGDDSGAAGGGLGAADSGGNGEAGDGPRSKRSRRT